jgi:hypothetical protein
MDTAAGVGRGAAGTATSEGKDGTAAWEGNDGAAASEDGSILSCISNLTYGANETMGKRKDRRVV